MSSRLIPHQPTSSRLWHAPFGSPGRERYISSHMVHGRRGNTRIEGSRRQVMRFWETSHNEAETMSVGYGAYTSSGLAQRVGPYVIDPKIRSSLPYGRNDRPFCLCTFLSLNNEGFPVARTWSLWDWLFTGIRIRRRACQRMPHGVSF